MPTDFAISERVRTWARVNGHGSLDEHLESFRNTASAHGYRYRDWDAAFIEAIRKDWARIRDRRPGTRVGTSFDDLSRGAI